MLRQLRSKKLVLTALLVFSFLIVVYLKNEWAKTRSAATVTDAAL